MTSDGVGAARRLGSQYELYELLGSGGMGDVYRGRRVESDEALAVKVLKPELARNRGVIARFVQESEALVKVRHRNVVAVHDLVVEGGTLAIVMDLVSGGDLRRLLESQGSTFSPAAAFDLAAQVLDALSAVHAQGILHRDIKPENVLIPFGLPMVARLADFGIAKVIDDERFSTTQSSLIGTPYYMAPEVGEGEPATQASDLYGVGCMLYELIAGSPPFTGSPLAVLRRHSDEEPRPIPGLAVNAWKAISQLLEKEPHRRPPSAADAALLLRRCQPELAGLPNLPVFRPGQEKRDHASPLPQAVHDSGTEGNETVVRRRLDPTGKAQSASAPVVPQPRSSRTGRHRLVAGAIGLIAVVAGVVAVVASRSSGESSATGGSYAHVFGVGTDTHGSSVVREWSAEGSELTSTVTVTKLNVSASTFDETIPKSLASDVSQLTFNPLPDAVVQRDPVVRYDLSELAIGDKMQFTWVVDLGADVTGDSSAMDRLAVDYMSSNSEPTATDGSTSASPTTGVLSSTTSVLSETTLASPATTRPTSHATTTTGPTAPAVPSINVSVEGTTIKWSWSVSSTGNSPLLTYRVFLDESDGLGFHPAYYGTGTSWPQCCSAYNKTYTLKVVVYNTAGLTAESTLATTTGAPS